MRSCETGEGKMRSCETGEEKIQSCETDEGKISHLGHTFFHFSGYIH